MTNKCTIISQLSHSSNMFRHYRVILREFIVSTLLSYTSMSHTAVGNTVPTTALTCLCMAASYIKATRPVLEIFKMAGYLPDSPRIYISFKNWVIFLSCDRCDGMNYVWWLEKTLGWLYIAQQILCFLILVSELMSVKKAITRNCTQYCLAWVFLPSVHVVKF